MLVSAAAGLPTLQFEALRAATCTAYSAGDNMSNLFVRTDMQNHEQSFKCVIYIFICKIPYIQTYLM